MLPLTNVLFDFSFLRLYLQTHSFFHFLSKPCDKLINGLFFELSHIPLLKTFEFPFYSKCLVNAFLFSS